MQRAWSKNFSLHQVSEQQATEEIFMRDDIFNVSLLKNPISDVPEALLTALQ